MSSDFTELMDEKTYLKGGNIHQVIEYKNSTVYVGDSLIDALKKCEEEQDLQKRKIKKDINGRVLTQSEIEGYINEYINMMVAWLIRKIFENEEILEKQGIKMNSLQELKFLSSEKEKGKENQFSTKKIQITGYEQINTYETKQRIMEYDCPIPTRFTGIINVYFGDIIEGSRLISLNAGNVK